MASRLSSFTRTSCRDKTTTVGAHRGAPAHGGVMFLEGALPGIEKFTVGRMSKTRHKTDSRQQQVQGTDLHQSAALKSPHPPAQILPHRAGWISPGCATIKPPHRGENPGTPEKFRLQRLQIPAYATIRCYPYLYFTIYEHITSSGKLSLWNAIFSTQDNCSLQRRPNGRTKAAAPADRSISTRQVTCAPSPTYKLLPTRAPSPAYKRRGPLARPRRLTSRGRLARPGLRRHGRLLYLHQHTGSAPVCINCSNGRRQPHDPEYSNNSEANKSVSAYKGWLYGQAHKLQPLRFD